MTSKWPSRDLVLGVILIDTLEKCGQIKSMSGYY